ncbi:terminase small subunit [Thiomicrorhabdus sp. 6S2-11]|uniref:Terminase small subunit n=1 Tax=Thiomicrorhabdus marina TaxID=2818442 RepID=A0ABS3Q8Q1_9GAMM|nr:terminase small subunit [Thiomicrorhabdus marina]MBO1928314.1 terminase small subunit [Thiomicrorhabdus marina]
MATVKEVAEHLGLTERRVKQMRQEGIIPTGKRGAGADLDACRMAYFNYLRVSKESTATVDDDQIDIETKRENLRLTKARADAQELKNLVEKQQLLPVEIMQESLAKVAAQISSILDTLPSKIKRAQPSLTNSEMDLIKGEIIRAQNLAAQSGEALETYLMELADNG